MTVAASFLQDTDFINVLYIVAFVLFIVGLRMLRGPRTAVRGNQIAAVGMAIAVVATLLIEDVGDWGLIALGLVTLFALNLGWFEPTGYVNLSDSPSGWLGTVTLPVIALSVGGIAGVAGQVRGSVVDALRQDYVRTLRSRGLSFNRVVFKHVLRNAGGPALAVLAVQFVGLLGGAVVVEQVFAIPGLGQVAVSSTTQGDIPLVMGLVVATAALVVIVNLVIDLAQGWLNPKVRL